MAIGKSFSRSLVRSAILGVAAFLALSMYSLAQAQSGESHHAARRAQVTTPAAPAPVFVRVKELAARERLPLASGAALPLPSDGKTIPTHVYSPYYTGTGATDTTFAASGARYFTMAFLQTATSGPACTVYWNGSTSTPVATTGTYATGIANIRANGGDVIPSFGGSAADTYNGTLFPELADRCTDVNQIALEYERVITTLNVTRIDLDTEEDSLRNPAGIDRRNKAIKLVQDWATSSGRSVEWVYTLPTNVQGLDAGVDGSNYTEGAAVLRNAIANGTRVDRVDIMTFDYYDDQSYACQAGQGPAHNMGADTITAATHLYDTLHELYPDKSVAELWAMVGFCEDVGSDDFGACEKYYLADATTDMAWAVPNGLGIITFWNYSRDTAGRSATGSPIWGYSHIFDNYSGTGPTLTGWGATTAIASSENPSSLGDPVTFTASITAIDSGLAEPTGNVQFLVDGVNSGSPVAVDGSGNAESAPISNLTTGNHTITATYSGDSVFTTASTTFTQSVGVPVPAAASIGITSSQNPVPFDQSVVTFTATVSAAETAPTKEEAAVAKPRPRLTTGATPTGTVQFLLDDVDLGAPVTLVNGQASSGPISDYPHPWPASGNHLVSAVYSGDANFLPGVSNAFTQAVENCGNCATSVTVASSPNPSYPGQTVSFTWNVGSDVGSPTGSVQILDGSTVLGTWPSISYYAGTVRVQSALSTLGNHSITAAYSGDADFAPNTSAPLTQVVSPAVSVTINTSPTGRSYSVDGGRSTTSTTNTTWAQGGQHTLATTSPQAGSSGTQYVWTSWSDGGAISHTVTAPTQTTTYTAYFNTQYQLTTAVSPSGAGTVTPATGGYDNANTPVPLTANPAAGYAFKNWTTTSGGTLTNANSATAATISLSGPATVTANFTELPTSLSGLITAKSGTQSARTWTITLSNTGPGAANAAQIKGLTLTQTFGAVCTPVIGTAFPLAVGNIGPGSSGSGAVAINFTGCPNNARFTVSFPFSANAGTVTGSRTLYNQFQ